MREFISLVLVAFLMACPPRKDPMEWDDKKAPMSGPEFVSVNFKKCHPADGESLESSVESEFYINGMRLNLEIFKNYPDFKFEIIGFTDSKECSEKDCNALALRRGKAVHEWLLSNGVSKSSFIRVAGLGSARPIDDNKTEEGRSRNRRVEIRVIP